jgi:hypothetical protein
MPSALFASGKACSELSSYRAQTNVASGMRLDEALKQALGGLPIRLALDYGLVRMSLASPVQAGDSVSGFLERLGKEQGVRVAYMPDQCLLLVEPPPLSKATPLSERTWRLAAGAMIHEQLKRWARDAGWRLIWGLDTSWVVPADTVYRGTFDQAVADVIKDLYAQGKPVRLILWEKNHVAEVLGHSLD